MPRGGAEEEEEGEQERVGRRVNKVRRMKYGETANDSQGKAQGRADQRTTRRQASCQGPYKPHARWRRSSMTSAGIEIGQQ